jgi:hypothetical protein
MKQLAYILFGALFTAGAAYGLGVVLIEQLRLALNALERRLFAFLLGGAALSLVVFAMAALHVFHRGVCLAVGAALMVWGWRVSRRRAAAPEAPEMARAWRWLFVAVFAGYATLYLPYALSPEMSPDGSTYHLGLVSHVARDHGFRPMRSDFYKNMPAGTEMLFLFAFEFGQHSAASLVHFGFLLLLPWLVVSYGRRYGFGPAAVFAAAAVFCSPVVGADGTCAYVDAGVATAMFGAAYLTRMWVDAPEDLRVLAAAGSLGGFAFSMKYTGAMILVFTVVVVTWNGWRARRAVWRPLGVVALAAAVWILPWTVKSWLIMGDPVTPFLATMFPNPNIHPSFVTEWSEQLRHYGMTGYGDLPRQLFWFGERTEGFLGPLFLLVPLGLLALKTKEGRFVLLAALFAAAPYPGNIGARFLIPALPFAALALGMVLSRVHPGLVAGVALAHAAISLPVVTPRYCSPYAWRLEAKWPWQAGLRLVPEDKWLSEHFPGYSIDRMLDRLVPAGERVYSMFQVAEAYTARDVVVSYESAPAETLQDAIFSAISSGYQPSVRVRFSFAPQRMRRVRMVNEVSSPAKWSVTEFRVMYGGKEIPRSAAWRVTARPDPWEAALAFDNNLATRWRSWQAERKGMSLTLDMMGARMVDGVELTLTPDQAGPRLKLEGEVGEGKWVALSGAPRVEFAPVPYSLRRDAMAALKRAGLHYFLVNTDAYGAEDLRGNAEYWGLKLIGESGDTRLYRIE